MTRSVAHIPATDVEGTDQFAREICESRRPVIFASLAARWPAVQTAAQSPHAVRAYAAQFDAGGQVEAFLGDARVAGKYSYTDDLTRFNFERKVMRLSEAGLTKPGAVPRRRRVARAAITEAARHAASCCVQARGAPRA